MFDVEKKIKEKEQERLHCQVQMLLVNKNQKSHKNQQWLCLVVFVTSKMLDLHQKEKLFSWITRSLFSEADALNYILSINSHILTDAVALSANALHVQQHYLYGV